MPDITLNLAAVVIAAVANVLIGALWFNTPFLFNKQWLQGIGKTAEQVNADSSPVSIAIAVIGALTASLMTGIIAGWIGIDSLLQGAIFGVMIGVVTAISAAIKDSFERRPRLLTMVNAGHDLFVFAVMGGVFGLILP
ncbi:MAG: DUF1761 domain-containing protein [Chloroflexi bacterium]|nr:DUF1761 domain-containing protein [Chloroflexota bacterium]